MNGKLERLCYEKWIKSDQIGYKMTKCVKGFLTASKIYLTVVGESYYFWGILVW